VSGAPEPGAGSGDTIRVRIRLFATYAEAAGCDALDVTLPAGAVAGDALDLVRGQPWAARLAPSPAVAVNERYAKADAALRDGDEVAIIPPVAGG
jgi:molybdopterin converting factor small subunit